MEVEGGLRASHPSTIGDFVGSDHSDLLSLPPLSTFHGDVIFSLGPALDSHIFSLQLKFAPWAAFLMSSRMCHRLLWPKVPYLNGCSSACSPSLAASQPLTCLIQTLQFVSSLLCPLQLVYYQELWVWAHLHLCSFSSLTWAILVFLTQCTHHFPI